MARKPKSEKVETNYQIIQNPPGARPAEIARLLGWNHPEVTRSLPVLEERGLLFSEDCHGGLWPVSVKNNL